VGVSAPMLGSFTPIPGPSPQGGREKKLNRRLPGELPFVGFVGFVFKSSLGYTYRRYMYPLGASARLTLRLDDYGLNRDHRLALEFAVAQGLGDVVAVENGWERDRAVPVEGHRGDRDDLLGE
jgi:hypothetical protein